MSQTKDIRLILALVTVAIVWGTTYLGIRIAVETIPGWYVAGLRQVVSSAILLVILLYKKEFKWVSWPHLRRQMILSSLMIVVANGMTTVAEETIPSGLTSLITSLSPIIVFIGSIFVGLQKATLRGFVGVILGFSGVVFIFRDGVGDLLDPNYETGIIYLAMAITGWAAGAIYAKKNALTTDNIFLDLFYQFVFAAVVQLIIAALVLPFPDASQWSLSSLGAVTYLGVFGSIVGFFAYNYALKRVTATEVSILSYFNTIIAIFLGWLVLSETVTFDLIIATVLIIMGVFITNYRKPVNK